MLFHRFQSLGTVLWIDGRYQSWVLVILLHVLIMVHCAELVKINIVMHACAPNPIEMFNVVNHSL